MLLLKGSEKEINKVIEPILIHTKSMCITYNGILSCSPIKLIQCNSCLFEDFLIELEKIFDKDIDAYEWYIIYTILSKKEKQTLFNQLSKKLNTSVYQKIIFIDVEKLEY